MPYRVRMLTPEEPTMAEAPSAPNEAEALDRLRELATDSIGPYRVLSVLGEGGFGVVYLAEQREPVQRRVALKVLKKGLDSRSVIARFEAERQALALLDHSSVAKVLDAGETPDGRPFFAMEYVAGKRITDFCDLAKMRLEDRLMIFIQVCEAVQHAHHKGIIHRDLKPSNILVAKSDDRPIAKVIDFGVAKAIGSRLTDKTVFTEIGNMIGTPEYMSPEQAVGGPDIDVRTDIYALGVVLYELLTGALPFDARSLRSAGYAGIQRMIQEDSPQRPSTRIGAETVAETGISRTVEDPRQAKTLSRRVRGDLDWIVMRCLEKDRARRYSTASALADEIHRYLRNEPVVAGPPSVTYRVGKFARRHRAGVAASLLVAMAVLLGLVGTTWQWVRAERALERETALVVEVQRESARARESSRFLGDMLSAVEPEVARGLDTELFERILTDATTRLDNGTLEDPSVEALVRQEIGEAYRSIALPDVALPQLRRAVTLAANSAGSDAALPGAARISLGRALWDVGDLDAADVAFAEAASEWPEGDPGVLIARALRGGVLLDRGEADAAVALLREVADAQAAELGEDDLATLQTQLFLGNAFRRSGAVEDAIEQYRAVYAGRRGVLGESHYETCVAANNLGLALRDAGRPAEAVVVLRAALEGLETVVGDAHSTTLSCMNNLGLALRETDRAEEAVALSQRVLDARLALSGPDHRETIAAMINLGAALRGVDRFGDAEAVLRRAIDTLVGMADTPPGYEGVARSFLALAIGEAGRIDVALAEGEKAWTLVSETFGATSARALRFAADMAALAPADSAWPGRAAGE